MIILGSILILSNLNFLLYCYLYQLNSTRCTYSCIAKITKRICNSKVILLTKPKNKSNSDPIFTLLLKDISHK